MNRNPHQEPKGHMRTLLATMLVTALALTPIVATDD